jgi:hypothetical protein
MRDRQTEKEEREKREHSRHRRDTEIKTLKRDPLWRSPNR